MVLSKDYSLSQTVPTISTVKHEGQIIGEMSSNVDDLWHGELPGHEKQMKEILTILHLLV